MGKNEQKSGGGGAVAEKRGKGKKKQKTAAKEVGRLEAVMKKRSKGRRRRKTEKKWEIPKGAERRATNEGKYGKGKKPQKKGTSEIYPQVL